MVFEVLRCRRWDLVTASKRDNCRVELVSDKYGFLDIFTTAGYNITSVASMCANAMA